MELAGSKVAAGLFLLLEDCPGLENYLVQLVFSILGQLSNEHDCLQSRHGTCEYYREISLFIKHSQ